MRDAAEKSNITEVKSGIVNVVWHGSARDVGREMREKWETRRKARGTGMQDPNTVRRTPVPHPRTQVNGAKNGDRGRAKGQREVIRDERTYPGKDKGFPPDERASGAVPSQERAEDRRPDEHGGADEREREPHP